MSVSPVGAGGARNVPGDVTIGVNSRAAKLRAARRRVGRASWTRSQSRQGVRVGLREDTVPEIEDVAGATGHRVEDLRVSPAHGRTTRAATWVEVPLDSAQVQPPTSLGRSNAPVEPDHSPRRGQVPEKVGAARTEVDRRHVDSGEDPGGVGRNELPVVLRREVADPRVEELDHVRTGVYLGAGVARECVGEPVHQRVPDLVSDTCIAWSRESFERAAFDQVAGDRERPTHEADQGLLRREVGSDELDRLERVREALGRLERPTRSTSRVVRIGASTTGPTPSTSSTSTPMPSIGSMMSE